MSAELDGILDYKHTHVYLFIYIYTLIYIRTLNQVKQARITIYRLHDQLSCSAHLEAKVTGHLY